MNLLFRLSQDIDGFEDIESAKSFFTDVLPTRDNNYFFNTKKFSNEKIKMNDIIYFSYDGYIIAQANFLGEIKYVPNRYNSKYEYGHKLDNIKTINSNLKLNLKDFKVLFSMKYIDTQAWQKEIDRVIHQELIKIYPDEIDDKNLFEGAKKQITVNAYERSSQARQECINEYGYKCVICNFDFEKTYGEIGHNFIHVHHLKPLSEIDEKYKIDPIEDLRPVCPNCHAMLHKRKPAYSIEEIKDKINK
jgi:predicted restriction endonuclease